MSPAGAPERPTARARTLAGVRRPVALAYDSPGPARPGPPEAQVSVIDRPRLLSAPWRRLLLATAPAGYGKTLFLKQVWSALPDKGVVKVWLSLGPEHRDFSVFLRDLSEALQAQAFAPPAWRGRPEEMGARLAHAVARGAGSLYLVLDDYHAAAGAELDAFVRALNGSRGNTLHVAIATRSRANIGAAVLAARGEVNLISATDLAFSLEETQRLLGGRDAHGEALALHTQAGGWPAALHLASRLALGERPGQPATGLISATSGEVAALIREETFDLLPEALQTLLVETAYLETLNADNVDDVRGHGDSAGLLDELEHSGALVFSDSNHPGALRRHPLFQRFLEARFALLGDERRSELADRTMHCLTRMGAIGSAFRLAHRWSPGSVALEWLEQAPPEGFWTADSIFRLPDELSALDAEDFVRAPRASLVRGLALHAEGRIDDARMAFEANLQRMRPAGTEDAGREWKVWEGLRAGLFDEVAPDQLLEDLAAIARGAPQRRSRLLPAHAASVLALRTGQSEDACALARLVGGGGEDPQAPRIVGAIHEAVTGLFDASPRRAATALAGLETAPFDDVKLEAAFRLCGAWAAHERGASWSDEDLPPHDAPPLLLGLSPELLVERARLAVAASQRTGGIDAAAERLREARAIARTRQWWRSDVLLEAETLTSLARAGVRGAKIRVLAESLAQRDNGACPEAILALARCDLVSGAWRRARGRLAGLFAAPAVARRWRVEGLILDARAAHALEQESDVSAALEQFLVMSAKGVMVRCFHDDGAELWEPLMASAARMAASDSDGACLDVAAELAITRALHGDETPLEPPTEQERLMFAALRRTGSRAGAARDLAMSENTLKYYLKRVFEKWDVRDWRIAMHVAERLAV
jgi:LuxR family transcriptional regulator, maltose regulon positive regulatory protein